MIDAHQHFWEIGRAECTWPTPQLPAIYRNYGPADLADLIAREGITQTVLVQSQADDRDTDYLCEIASCTPRVAAVVGWVDFESGGAPARIASLASRPKLRGLRPMLQDLADDRILDPAAQPAVQAMIAHDLSLDALVRPRHLPHLRVFAERYSALRIVIDHAAKPFIAAQHLDPWREHMRALATLPNVYCKLSGLVTEASPNWNVADLTPYAEHIIECFGPDRLMWGSDWPVVNLAADYQRWARAAQELTRHLDARDREAIFTQTATRFYRLS